MQVIGHGVTVESEAPHSGDVFDRELCCPTVGEEPLSTIIDPALDLSVSRIIAAPREAVWQAWADPTNFAQWWVPAPQVCRVEQMDLRPAGSFRTRISEDGDAFGPHITGCFLAVDELSRIVFTDALVDDWRPARVPSSPR